jgi:tRNA modification GTPase
MKIETNDIIVALATAHGSSAIAIIRLSGPEVLNIVEPFIYSKTLKKISLKNKPSHSVNFALIVFQDNIIDEVLITLFKNTNSYTGQDSIEISCHGSPFIQQKLLQLFLSQGARMANAGEFTLRAFLNGKLDLSQAEAVSDLIASNSALSHQFAMQQMRGGFSTKINQLRQNLINFASLIELELDFSEEDVEFANRDDLKKLISTIYSVIEALIQSFELGNVIKNGIPVTIIGKPNAGKSTLLNMLLEEDKAIVSEIAGTTRDLIEDEMIIDGVMFRFIDTAGLRITSDAVEQIGLNKAFEAIKKSAIVIYLFDAHELTAGDLVLELQKIEEHLISTQVILVANKIDIETLNDLKNEFIDFPEMIFISAKKQLNIHELKNKLLSLFDARTVSATDTIVTNARHASSLTNTNLALKKVLEGLNNNIVPDLLALDIRYALNEIGLITGEVSNEDLLNNIFSKFCIGK